MVDLRNRRPRVIVEDESASDEDYSEEERTRSRPTSPPVTNTPSSPLFESLKQGSFQLPNEALSLGQWLNLAFELSGYPADLYENEEYETALDNECVAVIDSSLERCGNVVVSSTSPLMYSIRAETKSQFIDYHLKRCFSTAQDLVGNDYLIRADELIPVFQQPNHPVFVKTGNKMVELVCKTSHQLDKEFVNTKLAQSLCKKYQHLNTNLHILMRNSLPLKTDTALLQKLLNWLVLFSTSRFQILRVTGIQMLQNATMLLHGQVKALLLDHAHARDEIEQWLELLFDVVEPTLKDRCKDVNFAVAQAAYSGYLQIQNLKLRSDDSSGIDAVLDVTKLIVLRHPSPLVRSMGVAACSEFCANIPQAVSVLCSLKPHKAHKLAKTLYENKKDVATITSALQLVLLPLILKHARDRSVLVGWCCLEYVKNLFDLEAGGNFQFNDGQITMIVSLMFQIAQLPQLPSLALFVDQSVFNSSIVDRQGAGTIVPEVVYSTLIQFLTDYADDPAWIPHHHQIIRAFYTLSPPCRDFKQIWEFLNAVYKPAGLSDTAQQVDWLTKPKAAETLLFLTECVWQCNEVVRKRSTTDRQTPSLFSSNMTFAELTSSLATQNVPWTPENLFVDQVWLNKAFENDLSNLLYRSRQIRPQFLRVTNLLHQFLRMYSQVNIGEVNVTTVNELLVSFIPTVTDPLDLHSILRCLSYSAGKLYYSHYSHFFERAIKAAQKQLKNANNTAHLITESAAPSPRQGEQVLKLMASDPVERETLRQLLVLLRAYIYNDKGNLISDKLEFLDDLLNYIDGALKNEDALTASCYSSDENQPERLVLVDIQMVANALDLVWLAHVKLLERVTTNFDTKILPMVSTQIATPLHQYSISRSTPTEAASTTSYTSEHIVEILRSFDEDIEIFKEMNLQISCFYSSLSEKLRQMILTHRYDTHNELLVKNALICSLQCCRALSSQSIFQTATKLWPHTRLIIQKLPASSDEVVEKLKQKINANALACFIPTHSTTVNMEIAYFLDTMKQLYSHNRRAVENYFSTHPCEVYGFFDQYIGLLGSSPSGPTEIWDAYKNLTRQDQIAGFLDKIEIEKLAFVSQVQLTRAITNLPDKTLWKDSSIGPVILAYFRSKSAVLRELANEFIQKCVEYDNACEQSQIEDVTDRPLVLALILNTIHTLVRRSLEKADNLDEVTTMTKEMALALPKDYWKSVTNLLFMNFLWMTIQKAYTCDPRGGLLDVVLESGLLSSQDHKKRYSKAEAGQNIEALKELAKQWHAQNPDVAIDKIFNTRLARFLRTALPVAPTPDLNDWPHKN